MRIYLIRHGRQNSPLCNVNVPLSDAGRRQAELLGERLKKESIDAVWSSDLIRACETADIINEKLHAPRLIREGLREISFGDLEGLSDDVILERCYAQNMGGGTYKSNLPDNLEIIKEAGYKNVMVDTDGGQTENPHWEIEMAEYMQYLLDHGIPEEQVYHMTHTIPAGLLGI